MVVPSKWTVVLGNPLDEFKVQVPPGQNLRDDNVRTGTSGPQCRSLLGMFTVVGFPAEIIKAL